MEEYLTIYYAAVMIWYVVFLIFIMYLSQAHSGEYKSQYKNSRYTDIPSKKLAVELSLLMYKKIIPEVLTVSIISMIDKGILRIERTMDDYVLYLNPHVNQNKMIASEKFIITLLFETMGEIDHVSFSTIAKFCDSNHGRSEFQLNYQLWLAIIRKETILTDYYEPKTCYTKIILYKYVGLILFLINIIFNYHTIIGYGMILPSFFLEFYFMHIFKRTRVANDEYHKWLSFKNYLPNSLGNNAGINRNELLYYGLLLKVKNIETLLNDDYCYGLLNDGIKKCVRKSCHKGSKAVN
ncbi:MAG: DUF2207 family protein [Ignavibacteriales bacterium]